ncbi:hyaluronoglucosaminidase [Streptomyces sp. BPTC-684]|uniref:hyaluronoglucosaminidase n=1 Tax=Streptomyces sp. BPTC-684 TaxID=3043734 RepID=UPI0024B1A074|nr:hyaluronoglucosaminidase [Streptomyces sp. BPTC-684]WHM38908.1 hyaluronoglucosaminidase [Streptomyces sp. BPTC-684]
MTVAIGGTATEAEAAGETTTFPGPVVVQGMATAQKFNTDATGEAAYLKTTSTVDHAATIRQAATSGSGAALNVVSDNPDSSAMYLKGVERNSRGTLKIAHVGHADGSDAGASALSIDLQTSGTASQGIFMTATDGPTSGALLVLRNNAGLEDFVVKGSGLIGVGIDRGATPRAQVHVVQRTSKPGLLVDGVLEIGNAPAAPTKVESAAGGGSLFAQGGALWWRGSQGTVTRIAPA